MTRQLYLTEVIRLYLEAHGTPDRPSRRDWAIAGDLYRLGVSLPDLEHAFRLASLRRLQASGPPPPTIRSLAYYRTVLLQLTENERHPGYVLYVHQRHRQLCSP